MNHSSTESINVKVDIVTSVLSSIIFAIISILCKLLFDIYRRTNPRVQQVLDDIEKVSAKYAEIITVDQALVAGVSDLLEQGRKTEEHRELLGLALRNISGTTSSDE
jgi:nanoRNase/pAp phosphatase (c-di-AMP/oligoRNAs hydrolase)